jgi:hypothetical protein
MRLRSEVSDEDNRQIQGNNKERSSRMYAFRFLSGRWRLYPDVSAANDLLYAYSSHETATVWLYLPTEH